jgi:hypothetical protein
MIRKIERIEVKKESLKKKKKKMQSCEVKEKRYLKKLQRDNVIIKFKF